MQQTVSNLLGPAGFYNFLGTHCTLDCLEDEDATQALTLPLTAAVGFFLFQRWRTARLAQEMQARKAASEAASAAGKPLDEDRQEAARLADELRDFDAQLGRRR